MDVDVEVEDIDEDETDWNSACTDLIQHTPAAVGNQTRDCSKVPLPPPQRIILHFDMDCFYAQVEMIRNPALRNVPLGIQQKYIIVTCNYVARDHGVTKLMSVTDAIEKCPQLVLVKGEDLTHYREMSYKLTELLLSYCPLVERLGFDENFMDVTELVERRMRQAPESDDYSVEGHVYNHNTSDAKVRDHSRLAVGSHIATELRAAIHSKLGLTGCAGIATNKLLAKLVSGTFKPNQQTTLLPESVKDILNSLNALRKVPGIGHQTAKRLLALGLDSVSDLQFIPLAELVKEFGASTAQRLRNLALGIDDTPVNPTGAPQSLSDEDSFKKMSSTKEVWQKVQDLLSSLLERMHKDGRQPLTFRLSVRRYSATNKWLNRESRQCPIPNHIGQKITSGSSDALAQVVTMAMKLFQKMVDSSAAFHLTLINVCFSNLQARSAASKGCITSFFTQRSPGKTEASSQYQDDLPPSAYRNNMRQAGSDVEGVTDEDASQWIPEMPPNLQYKSPSLSTRHSPVAFLQHVEAKYHTVVDENMNNTPERRDPVRLPPNVDPEVFHLLPEDIQKELLSSSAYPEAPHSPPRQSTQYPTALHLDENHSSHSNPLEQCVSRAVPCKFIDSFHSAYTDRKETGRDVDQPNRQTINDRPLPDPLLFLGKSPEEGMSTGQALQGTASDSDFPVDVDPKVFSELPPEVQRDLLAEWRQHKSVTKASSSKKQGRKSLAKEKKAPAKSIQANNLMKYFKPS